MIIVFIFSCVYIEKGLLYLEKSSLRVAHVIQIYLLTFLEILTFAYYLFIMSWPYYIGLFIVETCIFIA